MMLIEFAQDLSFKLVDLEQLLLNKGATMPVKVQKRGKKFRVVEAMTMKIVKNKAGTPVDGGGHAMQIKAMRQAKAINMHIK